MKDRERISNVEELLSDVLRRLDRMEDGQNRLFYSQNILHKDIEQIKDTMCSKTGLNHLFEAMMSRFDAMDNRFTTMDKRFDSMDKRFDSSDQRMDTMQGDINFINQDLTTVKIDVNHLKSR